MAVSVTLREANSQVEFTADNETEASRLFLIAWGALPTETAKRDARIEEAVRLLGA